MTPWEPGEPGVVTLPGGGRVRGRRWSATPAVRPQWGLYAMWTDPGPPWPHGWIRWPDFGLPLHSRAAWLVIEEAVQRSRRERMEVACGGGRGRTGTVLAAMAVLDGMDPDEAVRWVRREYHPGAVETPWQRRWLRR